MHGTGLLLARRLFLLSQTINNPAKMNFEVETSNDSFAHCLMTNTYQAEWSARTLLAGGTEEKGEHQLYYKETTRLVTNRVSLK